MINYQKEFLNKMNLFLKVIFFNFTIYQGYVKM